MHKMCQIPHPHRRLRPMSHLLDLATLTTACKKGKLRINVQSEYQVWTVVGRVSERDRCPLARLVAPVHTIVENVHRLVRRMSRQIFHRTTK